ncbi:hypothetical protein J8F10_01690 [Gemmata sp. G18]|uniref:CsbD family protein n=1 Tax=Gemmata palustris TaxID=2822762 RepID=A0ABS5BJX5_9BACT|nr:hypothetical protein [Gemmata palustris]MBP3954010.1 hypothetical protein [Gemmata palustris]
MAGGNAIGTGAVVLTANADQLLVGLKKAEAATESWAARTRVAAGKTASAIGGKLGGGASEVFGVAKDKAKQMATDFATEGARSFGGTRAPSG